MKQFKVIILCLMSIFTYAKTLDCSLFIIDEHTGREISEDAQKILEDKEYQLTTNAEEAKFQVVLHTKKNPSKLRTYEKYEFVQGVINGEEVYSGRTIESRYDGFFDELGDAFKNIVRMENPFEAVDSCSNIYDRPTFEYIEAR